MKCEMARKLIEGGVFHVVPFAFDLEKAHQWNWPKISITCFNPHLAQFLSAILIFFGYKSEALQELGT